MFRHKAAMIQAAAAIADYCSGSPGTGKQKEAPGERGMNAAMNIVFIGLSITSSWGNGHATTYRALLQAGVRPDESAVAAAAGSAGRVIARKQAT
jgi:hypothetical protein